MKLYCAKKTQRVNALKPLFDGAILLNPLQVFFKTHVGDRFEDLKEAAPRRGRFYLLDRRRPIYCIVDNQYRHFIPSLFLARRFSYKRTTTTIPMGVKPYTPNSFPGFIVVKTSQGYVAFIAFMRMFKKANKTDVALDYVRLGKVQAFKPVYDKDGWLIKIKVLLENGKRFTLRRTGMPRKYPELKKGPVKYVDYSQQNEVYINRLIKQLRHVYQLDKLEGEPIDFVPLYKSVLRTARRVVKSGLSGIESPVQVPAWLALAGLPHFNNFKAAAASLSFESLKWLLLVNLTVIIRRQMLKYKGEDYALHYARRVLGIPSSEIFEYFDLVYTPDCMDVRHLRPKKLVHLLSIPECPSIKVIPGVSSSEAVLLSYYEYCRGASEDQNIKRKAGALSTILLTWITQIYAAKKLLENETLLRKLLSFPEFKIVAVDATLSRHPRAVSILVWMRYRGPLTISGYNECGHSLMYRKGKYKLVSGYIDYQKPVDYLLDFAFQEGIPPLVETNVHYVERRHHIIKRYVEDRNREHHYTGVVFKEGNKRILKRLLAKNEPFPFTKHGAIFGKHFPFSVIATARGASYGYSFAYPIKPEFDSFNIIRVPEPADLDVDSAVAYQWYIINSAPIMKALLRKESGELLFSKVCMGFLSELQLPTNTARDEEMAERHAYLMSKYLRHIALENDQGYCSPWQFGYSHSWTF